LKKLYGIVYKLLFALEPSLINHHEQIFNLIIRWPIFLSFFCNPRCPGQLTRTTTNPRTHWTPCKPSRQVRHRGGDRRARWGSNPGDRGKKTLYLPLGHKPQCFFFFSSFFNLLHGGCRTLILFRILWTKSLHLYWYESSFFFLSFLEED